METKKYYYLVSNNTGNLFSPGEIIPEEIMGDEVRGPFTAKEMLRLNLPENTLVTDDIDSNKWKAVINFDFVKILRDERNAARVTLTLILKDNTYHFYFLQDDTEYGPGSARKMLELELPPDTPVTEDSLDGQWFKAGNFDFQALSEEEVEETYMNRSVANKNVITGLIWMVVGGAITYYTYKKASVGGGTYVICWGAILFGFIQFIKGLFGSNSSSKEEDYIDDESETDTPHGEPLDEPLDISLEEMNELYAELGLTPDATNKEVKHAYHVMAKRYHPDLQKNMSEEEKISATEKFRNIQNAFELIKRLRNMK